MPPKILIVDDEDIVGKVLEDALRKGGYEIARAISAENGLEILQSFRPDLIISDVWMPGMNGYTFCKLARKMSEATIIMMSGVPSEVSVLKEMDLDVDDILIKPIDLKEFTVRVNALLQKDAPSKQQEGDSDDSSQSPVSGDEQDPFEIFKELRLSIQNSIGRTAERLGISEDFIYQIIILTLDGMSDDEIADDLGVKLHQVQNWRGLILADYGIDLSTGANSRIKIMEALIRESQKSRNFAKQRSINSNRIDRLPDATRSVLHRYANGWDIASISNDLDIDQLSVKEHMDLACYQLGIKSDSHQDRLQITSSLYLLHQLGEASSD